jgi:transposase
MVPGIHDMLGFGGLKPQTALERQLLAEVEWFRAELARRDEIILGLQRRIAQLEVAVAKGKKNSRTSSKPPSSDIVKPPPKTNPDTESAARKIGAQRGHKRHDRPPFSPEEVTGINYTLDACPDCGYGGIVPAPDLMKIIQQVEVVQSPLGVHEHRSLGYWCPLCGKIHYAPLPASVEKGGLIGPILTAQIAYMKGVMHASFTTIRKYVRDVMGLTLSRGYLSKLLQKVSDALADPYADVLALLKSEAVLNVDETGHKDNAKKFWTWCFRAKGYCVFTVASTRSLQVLLDVLGEEFQGVLGCDHFTVYRKYLRECDVRVQFCLAHFIREIRFLTTLSDPAVVDYGNRVLDRIRTLFFAIHNEDLFSPASFTRALEAVRDAIVQEAQRDVPELNEAQLIAKRLREYEDQYFEFIRTPEIEPTNNPAEQAQRFVVIDRYITQGTRSEKGRQWSERIWTVVATCSIQGRSAYDYLVEAVQAHFNGKPIPKLLPHPT